MENFDVVQRAFSWSVSEKLPKFESRYLSEAELMVIEIKGEGLNIRIENRKNELESSCWMRVDGRQLLHVKASLPECLEKLSEKLEWWKEPDLRVRVNL